MVFVVKDIIMIFRKNETILILISFKTYFSHPEKSIHKSSLTLGGIVILGTGQYGFGYTQLNLRAIHVCLDTLTSIRMFLPTQTSNIVKYSNIRATQI